MWFDLSVYFGKTTVVLIYLFVGYRLLGKRQVAQFNLYDLATLIAIANAVQNAMTRGKGDLAIGLVCSTSLIVVGWLISKTVTRLPRTEAALFGTPTIILSNGRMLEERMKRERVSDDELLAALREHGLVDASQVGLAVLEIDGSISVVPKQNLGSPGTAADNGQTQED